MTGRSATSSERTRREAREWLVRLRRRDAKAVIPAFEEWYAADPAHADAYDALLDEWDAYEAIALTPTGRSRTLARSDPPHRERAKAARLALAAVLLGLLAFGTIVLLRGAGLPQDEEQGSTRIATASGELRRMALADGSSIIVDADTRLVILFDRERRTVRLDRGRARFEVARDRRPFLVETALGTIEARGTVFDVAMVGSGLTVLLLEGAVDVRTATPGTRPGSDRPTRLAPGQELRIDPGVTAPAIRTAAEGRSAWTDGMLEFDDAPLEEVVAHANRHHRPGLRLDGPELGRLRVTGAWRANDLDGLAAGISAAFGLEVLRLSDGTLLLRRPVPGHGGPDPVFADGPS